MLLLLLLVGYCENSRIAPGSFILGRKKNENLVHAQMTRQRLASSPQYVTQTGGRARGAFVRIGSSVPSRLFGDERPFGMLLLRLLLLVEYCEKYKCHNRACPFFSSFFGCLLCFFFGCRLLLLPCTACTGFLFLFLFFFLRFFSVGRC